MGKPELTPNHSTESRKINSLTGAKITQHQRTPRKRNADATQQRILDAARLAFAQNGLSGARIDQIASAAEANVQMIYRYFGGKRELYLAVLQDTYARIRERERQLDLTAMSPEKGIEKLVEFTFDYLRDNPDFVALVRNENLEGGQFVRQLPMISETTLPLLSSIETLICRGCRSGAFKRKVDPLQLYVSIISLCITHVAQRQTLSAMFKRDLSDSYWVSQRRVHTVDLVMTYLTCKK